MTPEKEFPLAYEHCILAKHPENLEKLAVWWALQAIDPKHHCTVGKSHWQGKPRIRFGMGKSHQMKQLFGNQVPYTSTTLIALEPLFVEAVSRGMIVQSALAAGKAFERKAVIRATGGYKKLTSNKWHYNLATDTI